MLGQVKAGLPAMGVVALEVSDIDSKRMLIRAGNGRGGKGRFGMLSLTLIMASRDCDPSARPHAFMLSRRDKIGPLTTHQVHRICQATAEKWLQRGGCQPPRLALNVDHLSWAMPWFRSESVDIAGIGARAWTRDRACRPPNVNAHEMAPHRRLSPTR